MMDDAILYWNAVALEATRADFASTDPAVDPSPQQGGPTRTSRALAIVHLAMYDAYVGAIGGGAARYGSYSAAELPTATGVNNARTAVATAATHTLIALYGRQKNALRKQHQAFVAGLAATAADVSAGIAWGQLVGQRTLASRQNDGSVASDDTYVPSPEPGRHRPDPLNPNQGFLDPSWGFVTPFGIKNLNVKVPGSPPPALNSLPYTTAFKEAKAKGEKASAARTPEETAIGLFWAYDGARNIGVPPRLYNQVVRAMALKKGSSEAENAKLFAMVNVAMADAGIQAWSEKYRYNVWRPVIGVREASPGWGPTGQGDGNVETRANPFWLPLGAPRTNQPALTAFTPPFPSYPSGHASFGTAAIKIAQLALGVPDSFRFEVVSDELNGVSVGEDGSERTLNMRELTVASAIQENVASRVFLGVHWSFDQAEGQQNGEKIATMIHAAFPALA